MDNKKQYYTNLTSSETSIESRDGSKILMDSNGNVLLTTSRRTEYIDPLRQEYYQGNINLNPDEESSYFFIGTDQIIIDQQGNTNQDTIAPKSDKYTAVEYGALTPTSSLATPPIIDQTSILPDNEESYNNSNWINANGDNGEGSGFEGTLTPEQQQELDILFYGVNNIFK